MPSGLFYARTLAGRAVAHHYPPMLNPRLESLPDYPFDRLRALLDGLSPPPGLEPRVLSVGEPRHAPPPIIDAAVTAEAGNWGRYPLVEGTPAFRTAVAGWLTRRYGLPDGMIDADRNVLPVSGTREALFLAALLTVPGRTHYQRPAVLMPNPFYPAYAGGAMLAGAEAIYLPATRETGFLPDLSAVDDETLAQTALVYLCSPANPQGAVASADDIGQAIALALAQQHGFVLAVDECCTEIYGNQPPAGALQACAATGGDCTNVLVFHSLSKRSSAPGLRSGFVAGDAELIAGFRRLRSYGGATLPFPVLAASAALWSDDVHVEANRALYREKFDAAERILSGRLGFYRPDGGFFLWLDVGDGEAATRALWTEAAVRVLPGTYLGQVGADGLNPGTGFIRIALVDDLRATEDALDRLVKVL